MKSLRQYIQENLENGTAIGHFNFSTFDVAQAIVNAAKELNVPVILGLSEGERDFTHIAEAVAWVKATRENFYAPVFLNADHTYSFDRVKEAVDAGFDMVIFDDAGGNMDDNIIQAKKCRDYIDEHNKNNGTDVLFEAELGYIGKGSEIHSVAPTGIQKTTGEDAKKFCDAVNPDLLAPAVGNLHGLIKGQAKPALDPQLCGEILKVTGKPMVLHGASGETVEDVQACIKNGVAVVHVNTEIRVAYKEALSKHVVETEEVAPYKYISKVEEDVKKVVEEKLKVFNFL